ncbi:hypothetical protein ACTXT7_004772 [Hymenolepis weldensis]
MVSRCPGIALEINNSKVYLGEQFSASWCLLSKKLELLARLSKVITDPRPNYLDLTQAIDVFDPAATSCSP